SEAFSVLTRPRRTRGTLLRVMRLTTSSMPGGWLLVAVVVALQAFLVGFSMMSSGSAWIQWVLGTITVSGLLARAMDRSWLEFLCTRPLARRRLLLALILPCVGVVLVFPALEGLFVTLAASTPRHPFHRDVWWFLTRGLGAPKEALVRSADGVSIVMTPGLVHLLYREALREAFLGLSLLFVIPLWSSVSRATTMIRLIIGGLTVGVLPSIVAYYALLFTTYLWPLPPLWLTAFFALASGTLFFRQVLASHS
ncbi:MAG: hypothetical protein JWM82_2137, partial [Myxococcales bacterium]|nr:hypothetical protein [Myxococcales bacterium]